MDFSGSFLEETSADRRKGIHLKLITERRSPVRRRPCGIACVSAVPIFFRPDQPYHNALQTKQDKARPNEVDWKRDYEALSSSEYSPARTGTAKWQSSPHTLCALTQLKTGLRTESVLEMQKFLCSLSAHETPIVAYQVTLYSLQIPLIFPYKPRFPTEDQPNTGFSSIAYFSPGEARGEEGRGRKGASLSGRAEADRSTPSFDARC